MSDAARLKATVYVGGLDNAVSSQTLHAAFLPFGEIVDVTLPKPELPSSTDPHRGFGYVEFEAVEDAKEAIDNMDQSELFGRVIKVAQAKPQKEANEGLGSKTAVWEQVCRMPSHNSIAQTVHILMINAGRMACKTCCERRRSPGGRPSKRQVCRCTRRSHARVGRLGCGRTKARVINGVSGLMEVARLCSNIIWTSSVCKIEGPRSTALGNLYCGCLGQSFKFVQGMFSAMHAALLYPHFHIYALPWRDRRSCLSTTSFAISE